MMGTSPRGFAKSTLIGLIAILAVQPATHARTLSQWQQKLQDTSRKLSYVQHQLRSVKKQHKTAVVRLKDAEARYNQSQKGLHDIRVQLSTTRGKLTKTQKELNRIQRRLDERNDLLASRLSDTYKHGAVSYLNVLVGATDISDLLSRGYVVQKVVESDVDLISSIKEDKQAVKDHETLLKIQEQKRADLERQQSDLTHDAYDSAVERAQAVKDIASKRAELENMLDELERDSQQITGMIRQMMRARARAHRGRGSYHPTVIWKGGFMRPVPGRVTSQFGRRFHPILHQMRNHTGVDLAAPWGSPIHAAGAGEVIFAGVCRGYGNTVWIDHGGDVVTVYAHASSILVRVGQTVSQGQVVARVGTTGLSTGPHLHFEVRRNGIPVCPPF